MSTNVATLLHLDRRSHLEDVRACAWPAIGWGGPDTPKQTKTVRGAQRDIAQRKAAATAGRGKIPFSGATKCNDKILKLNVAIWGVGGGKDKGYSFATRGAYRSHTKAVA